MKVFQIDNGICFCDVTKQFCTAEDTAGRFPPDILFVEAPDDVFEGWGYQNGAFIEPTPPEGWVLDHQTGTFYPNTQDAKRAIYERETAWKVRRLYTVDEEFALINKGVAEPGNAEYLTYRGRVAACKAEARDELISRGVCTTIDFR